MPQFMPQAMQEPAFSSYAFNVPGRHYKNGWRICFGREPMVSRAGSDMSTIRAMFEDRLRLLFESDFY